ncbi:MAG: glycosyltransferase family 2 protein, partial [Anaerovoracaceae bacterium]
EENIYNTLKYLHQQDYQGAVTVWVADNNSTDGTKAEVERASKDFLKMPINYCFVAEQGKHFALNQALEKVETEYVVTIDADTLLHQKALRYLVARIDAYEDVGAVAGAIMAKNSRSNLWTKMQEWDYFISMAAIKKMQGMYQGTLVAQGAFSIYNTELVRSFGGWQDCIGEDIVLTWNFLKVNWKVYYEPLAVAFTEVPEKFVHLVRQRSRWARGMIEGLRAVKPWQQPNLYYKVLTLLDIAIIYIDFAYTFFFIPGVILALFGNYLIVGIMFFFVLPMTLATFIILMRLQKIQVFDQLELKVRRNIGGFILFILFYQCVMSPTALWGYAQELTGSKRTWK